MVQRKESVAALTLGFASEDDAKDVVEVRNSAAAALTAELGNGSWSTTAANAGIVNARHIRRVLVARMGSRVVATLTLQAKKPWAIDVAYFTPVGKAIYLVDMAVAAEYQRQGIGRRLLAYATSEATAWPADAIRLDAWDAAAGAGGFYEKCGFTEVGRVTYRNNPLVYYELVM